MFPNGNNVTYAINQYPNAVGTRVIFDRTVDVHDGKLGGRLQNEAARSRRDAARGEAQPCAYVDNRDDLTAEIQETAHKCSSLFNRGDLWFADDFAYEQEINPEGAIIEEARDQFLLMH